MQPGEHISKDISQKHAEMPPGEACFYFSLRLLPQNKYMSSETPFHLINWREISRRTSQQQ